MRMICYKRGVVALYRIQNARNTKFEFSSTEPVRVHASQQCRKPHTRYISDEGADSQVDSRSRHPPLPLISRVLLEDGEVLDFACVGDVFGSVHSQVRVMARSRTFISASSYHSLRAGSARYHQVPSTRYQVSFKSSKDDVSLPRGLNVYHSR